MSETTSNDVETVTASQLRQAFQERIGADQDKQVWLALDALIVQYLNERDETANEQVAELCRHFPSLERVMMIVWETICEPTPAS